MDKQRRSRGRPSTLVQRKRGENKGVLIKKQAIQTPVWYRDARKHIQAMVGLLVTVIKGTDRVFRVTMDVLHYWIEDLAFIVRSLMHWKVLLALLLISIWFFISYNGLPPIRFRHIAYAALFASSLLNS